MNEKMFSLRVSFAIVIVSFFLMQFFSVIFYANNVDPQLVFLLWVALVIFVILNTRFPDRSGGNRRGPPPAI